MSKTTLVSFVLDQTGSMFIVKSDTIGGFNEYIDSLRINKKKVLFSLTLFNSQFVDTRYVGTPIEKVQHLTNDTYKPAHMTPLYDAIGNTIRATEEFLESYDGKVKVLCVIFTDGEENDSKEFTQEGILRLIKEKEAEGWTFAYLGANQDAWRVGESIGIKKDQTMTYDQSHTRETLSVVEQATAKYIDDDKFLLPQGDD